MRHSLIVERLQDFFARQDRNIACAYLFGSHARGTAHAGSDADVAILYSVQPTAGLAGMGVDLADDLRAALHAPVDVVILNQASPDLVHRVLRDGILVCERDKAARVRFEVDARSRYFDLLPYMREYRRARTG